MCAGGAPRAREREGAHQGVNYVVGRVPNGQASGAVRENGSRESTEEEGGGGRCPQHPGRAPRGR
eukprot:1179062-Prorocentrum_minimum.AAC.1